MPAITGRMHLVMLAMACLGLFIAVLFRLHCFLAPNRPIDAQILVVEGWLPDYALKKAVAEFYKNRYQYFVISDSARSLSEHDCHRRSMNWEERLRTLGLDTRYLVVVSVPFVRYNRTFASAKAVRKWILDSHPTVAAVNLVSLDMHAKKSHISFKRIMEPDIRVGIIAVNAPDYDPRYWWLSVRGLGYGIIDSVRYLHASLWPL